jgi:signal transduction histidine kinase/ligand-binding sensor domain-containing protein
LYLFRSIRNIFYFFLAVFLLAPDSNLIAQQYPFVYYTPKDGLVNSRVRSISQDSKGRMYFITYGGLSEYDGVIFKNYSQQDGLANELVNDIIEMAPDSFLVASNAGELNTLVRGKIGHFKTSDHFCPVINRFFRSKDNDLYVTADEGFFKLVDNAFTRIPLTDSYGMDIGLNLDRITEWEDYFLIIPWNTNQKEKLIVFDKNKNTVTGHIAGKPIINASISPKNEVWVSSPDGIELLDLAALQNGIVRLKPLPAIDDASKLKGAEIYFDESGGTWIYQHSEVIYFTAAGEKKILSAEQGLKTNNLSDLMVDREGITWMASDGNGVIKLTGTHFQLSGDLKPGSRNFISVLIQQGDTTWLFNKTDHAIYQFHEGHLRTFPLSSFFSNVTNIYILGDDLYFVMGQKIYKVHEKDLSSSYLKPKLIYPENPKLEIGAAINDPYGSIIQYVRQNDTVFYLAVIRNDELIMQQPLSFALDQMAIDQDHRLWIPTRDHHFYVYSLHPETPSEYLRMDNDYSEIMHGLGPRSITIDNIGNAWIGTRYNGVYRFHFDHNKLQSTIHLTTLQGLTDNFIYSLHCDSHNNMWVGTQTGMDKISFKNGVPRIENITKSKNTFQGIYRMINEAEKVIWALTSNGEIVSVSEPDTLKSKFTPSLFITSLIVNDSLYEQKKTNFTYDQNYFSVRVATPSFLDEKSIRYSYWLKGGTATNWSKPSNNSLFNFINLAPGSYELNVKAEYPANIYPDKQLKYAFVISPPYWHTWWFWITLSVLTLGFITLAIRYYYLKKLEKQRIILEGKQALERERTRIATDMHDDLGAGLTRIKFLSETIGIKKQLGIPVEEEIQHIRSYSHEMIDKMGEIVWALNEKNDSLSDLFAYTRAYAVAYLSEHGIISRVTSPDEFPAAEVSGEFRRNMYLSVKEALHNIIKHAQATIVHLQFDLTDEFIIRIRDDGVGFDAGNRRPYSNGLLNMKKRMSDIGGHMEIEHGHGTTITLSAPLSL